MACSHYKTRLFIQDNPLWITVCTYRIHIRFAKLIQSQTLNHLLFSAFVFSLISMQYRIPC